MKIELTGAVLICNRSIIAFISKNKCMCVILKCQYISENVNAQPSEGTMGYDICKIDVIYAIKYMLVNVI